MGMSVTHLLADQVHDDFVVEKVSESLVWLSAGRVDLLATAAREGLRVVIVSGHGSKLTEAMRDALTAFDGQWVVDDGTQAYNGLNGTQINSWEDVGQARVPRLVADSFVNGPAGEDVRVVVSWSQRHRADVETVVGTMLEGFLSGVGLAGPSGWGVCEPVTEPWDTAMVTRFARFRMPDPTRIVVVGHDPDTLSATVVVQRTKHGVDEVVTGLVRIGPVGSAMTRDRLAAIPGVLAGLCESTMPLFGMVMAQTGRGDLTWGPWLPGVLAPVAVVIGPPNVHDLGINVGEAVERWSAIVAGRPKLPALVYPFTGEGINLAEQLQGILSGFDQSKLPPFPGRDIDSMGGGV